jgi:RNA polymerase sigma-32 factor
MSTSASRRQGPVSVELQSHLDRILSTERLSVEQERELMRRFFEDDDQEAADRLIETHLRFVVAIALRYRNYPIAMSDLVSEGTLGLMVALRKFDPSRGTRFVTYATFWIRAHVLDLVIRSWHSGKGGTGPFKSKVFFKLRREHARLASRFGTSPEGLRQMAREMGMKEGVLRDMLHRIECGDVSIDQRLSSDSATTFKDLIVDDGPDPESEVRARHDSRIARELVEDALRILDDREAFIVKSRLMSDEPKTLASVGETLGVSRERARQIEVRARMKLRDHLTPRVEGAAIDVA